MWRVRRKLGIWWCRDGPGTYHSRTCQGKNPVQFFTDPLLTDPFGRSRVKILWFRDGTLRAQILKKFKRATHQTPMFFCGEFWRSGLKISNEIEIFKRDWKFQAILNFFKIWALRVSLWDHPRRELLPTPLIVVSQTIYHRRGIQFCVGPVKATPKCSEPKMCHK